MSKTQTRSRQEMTCSREQLLCCPSCLSQQQGSPSYFPCLPRLVWPQQVGPLYVRYIEPMRPINQAVSFGSASHS